MKSRRSWGTGLAILALSGGAWPGMAQAQPDKHVVVYTSNESTLNTLAFSAFEKETGIKVQPAPSSPATARPTSRGRSSTCGDTR